MTDPAVPAIHRLSPLPSQTGLTDDEITALVRHVRSLKRK